MCLLLRESRVYKNQIKISQQRLRKDVNFHTFTSFSPSLFHFHPPFQQWLSPEPNSSSLFLSVPAVTDLRLSLIQLTIWSTLHLLSLDQLGHSVLRNQVHLLNADLLLLLALLLFQMLLRIRRSNQMLISLVLNLSLSLSHLAYCNCDY